MSTVHFEFGGPTRQIRIGKKTWTFEMHRQLGPMLVNSKGDALKREPLHVLEAISWWAQQGQRIDQNGYCIYEKPSRFG